MPVCTTDGWYETMQETGQVTLIHNAIPKFAHERPPQQITVNQRVYWSKRETLVALGGILDWI